VAQSVGPEFNISTAKKKKKKRRAGGVGQGVHPQFKPQYHCPHKKQSFSWVLAAHTYNPCNTSYSGGKDQEDWFKASPGK
jgi:hypothetical protein